MFLCVCLSQHHHTRAAAAGELGEALHGEGACGAEGRRRREGGGGFSVARRRANSCAGAGAPQLRRGSDIQIWAGLPCGLGDTLQPAPPPLYSGPASSLGMALKKEIKFPPESKAP